MGRGPNRVLKKNSTPVFSVLITKFRCSLKIALTLDLSDEPKYLALAETIIVSRPSYSGDINKTDDKKK